MAATTTTTQSTVCCCRVFFEWYEILHADAELSGRENKPYSRETTLTEMGLYCMSKSALLFWLCATQACPTYCRPGERGPASKSMDRKKTISASSLSPDVCVPALQHSGGFPSFSVFADNQRLSWLSFHLCAAPHIHVIILYYPQHKETFCERKLCIKHCNLIHSFKGSLESFQLAPSDAHGTKD